MNNQLVDPKEGGEETAPAEEANTGTGEDATAAEGTVDESGENAAEE